MSGMFLDRIRSADNLPSLSTVALEVLRLTKKEDTSVAELAATIENDPALTAKLFKVVNSSLFALSREVTSISQAIGLLGLRAVKVMALSFSLVETVRSVEEDTFEFEAYWRRSLTTAVAARLIGKITAPQLAETAFVAGILSDIGIVAAWRCAPDVYKPVLAAAAATKRPLPELERDYFGFTHAAMGRELLQSWGLPETLCAAVGSHHGEGLANLSGEPLELATLVHSAAVISGLFCNETACDSLDSVKAQCIDETGVDTARLEEVLRGIDTHVKEAASMLSIGVGETMNYAQVQLEAATQLAQLSMQAELERSESARKEHEARVEAERLHQEKRAILEVASTDGLTKVANRAAFDKHLDQELKQARAKRQPLGLIMMDVDHFKRVNDVHGHQAGDEVLRNVGACLASVVDNLGFVARYGGEEFVVVVTGETAERIRDLAQRIRQTLERIIVRHQECDLRLTASFGVAYADPCAADVTCKQLVEQADQQLYKAKRNGRNRVEAAGQCREPKIHATTAALGTRPCGAQAATPASKLA
jgi:two-component system cell cycle response regulator